MKKLIYLFLFSTPILLAFFSAASTAIAQEQSEPGVGVDSVIAPDYFPPPEPEPGFLGQDHSYTVVFRGNGEAVVSAKIAFTNKGENELQDINLRIPRVEPREVSVYQIILQKRCVRYEPGPYNPMLRTYNSQVCIEYQEPSYYYDYWGSAKYQKAKTQLDVDTLKVSLPVSVQADKSGAFFVYFRANGYTKKGIIGAYNYTFETLKAEENIRNLRVGISTDSDLFLKGAKGEVAYRFEDAALESFAKTGAQTPEASTAIDAYVNQIGQGTVIKTASNLASLESYTVKGTYADSRTKLYGTEIFTALIVLLVAGILVFAAARFVLKRVNKSAGEIVDKKTSTLPSNSQSILLILGVSFVSSILILFYTIFVFFLGNFLQRVISYQFDAFITIFLVLISFVIYSLVLFAPGIYIGIKKGIGWGVGDVVMTLFWLILYFIVAIFVIFILFGSDYYPGPIIPLMTK